MRPLIAIAALLLCASAADAQTGPAPRPTAPAAPHYTLETPISVLMEDPKMLAWLDRHFPGLSDRMRDPEVATIFAGSSIDDMSKDSDHGRALTPAVMARLAKSLEAAQSADPAS